MKSFSIKQIYFSYVIKNTKIGLQLRLYVYQTMTKVVHKNASQSFNKVTRF